MIISGENHTKLAQVTNGDLHLQIIYFTYIFNSRPWIFHAIKTSAPIGDWPPSNNPIANMSLYFGAFTATNRID